jgi:hypothetical protein
MSKPAGEIGHLRDEELSAVRVIVPSLADGGRLPAAQRATADQRASFETFLAQHGLSAQSLAAGLAPGTPRAV